MIRQLTIAAGVLGFMAVPALADCAADIEHVQQALEAGTVAQEQRAVVEDALNNARMQAGNEEACQAALAPALEIVGRN